ncbi:MAG: hypothetical protein QW101_07420 [Ignisphaera sp.]
MRVVAVLLEKQVAWVCCRVAERGKLAGLGVVLEHTIHEKLTIY